MIDFPSGDLAHDKALMALMALSPTLRNEVLASQTIAEKFKIELSQPVSLDDMSIDRTVLFRALGNAADNFPIGSLEDLSGKAIEASISMESDGTGVVTIGKKRWRFEDAVFLSSQTSTRQPALEARLQKTSLAVDERRRLRQLVGKADFNTSDFFSVVEALMAAPESFARALRGHLEKGQIGEKDLLPEDVRHWDHLVPPPSHSATLEQYQVDELKTEWAARLAENPANVLSSVALSCAAPSLVPRSLFSDLPVGIAVAFVRAQAHRDDFFGTIAALQLCADRLADDAQFANLGDELLGRLFGNTDKLATECQIFAAAFIVATANLASHEVLGRRPTFWRRLAAATHASLVVRACEVSEAKQDGLIPWAVRIAGERYFLSVLSDFLELPRWRPEWIEDNYIFADVYGRALAVWVGIAEPSRPANWKARLDAVRESKAGTTMEILSAFPAVLEGAPRSEGLPLPESGPVYDLFKQFIDEPGLENLLMIAPLIYTFGFPAGLRDKAARAIEEVARIPSALDNPRAARGLDIASYIAVEMKDQRLADLVAETCISAAGNAARVSAVGDATYRILECGAAYVDQERGPTETVKRLERLAVVLPTAEMCDELLSLLEQLKRVQPRFRAMLGRALAWASLGRTKVLT